MDQPQAKTLPPTAPTAPATAGDNDTGPSCELRPQPIRVREEATHRSVRDPATGNRISVARTSSRGGSQKRKAAGRTNAPDKTATARQSAPVSAAASATRRLPTWLIPVAAGVTAGALIVSVATREDTRSTEISRATSSQTATIPADTVSTSAVTADVGTSSAPEVRPKFNGDGRLTRLAARKPEHVLEALCSAGYFDETFEAVGLQASRPFRKDVRVGVMRRANGGERAVWIRRNPQTREWFVGDGLRPLIPKPLPES